MTQRPKMTAGRPSAGQSGTTIADLVPEKVRINGDISSELHRRVKIQAVKEGVTMTEIMAKALSEYLENHSIT